MTITLGQAMQVIAAAKACATQLGIAENIAVVNADCRLIAFVRMDGAILAGTYGAQGKASASAAFNSLSSALQARYGAGAWLSPPPSPSDPSVPVPTLPGVAAAEAPEGRQMIFSQGGAPIIVNGVLIGAVGCGGGTAAQDEQCAIAGAAGI